MVSFFLHNTSEGDYFRDGQTKTLGFIATIVGIPKGIVLFFEALHKFFDRNGPPNFVGIAHDESKKVLGSIAKFSHFLLVGDIVHYFGRIEHKLVCDFRCELLGEAHIVDCEFDRDLLATLHALDELQMRHFGKDGIATWRENGCRFKTKSTTNEDKVLWFLDDTISL